jgi:septal ring factor EnvC (AmiA/AmiB activator)
MSQGKNVLVLLVLASIGLWGCAQGPNGGSASVERVRALESKIAKLEEDFKASVAIREQLRKKLTSADEAKTLLAQQVEQLQTVVKERDELRQQLASRTNERDNLHAQFNQFRKGIKTLLGQSELPSTLNSQPVTSAAVPPAPNKS